MPLLPRVTVVIPAWNAENFLARSIASVFCQTDQDFDLLIVNDGSNDSTEKIASTYLTDHRVRLMSNPSNCGLASTLNAALTEVRTPLLLHLDADDWLEPMAIDTIRHRFSQLDRPAAVVGRAIFNRDSRRWLGGSISRTRAVDFLEATVPTVPRVYDVTVLRRLGGWKCNDPFGGRYYEDRLMLSRIAREHVVSILDKPIYNVSVQPDSLSRRDPMVTATAKYSILCNEAASLGCCVDTYFSGPYLGARFISVETVRPWTVIMVRSRTDIDLTRALRAWRQSDLGSRDAEILLVDLATEEAMNLPCRVGQAKTRHIRSPGLDAIASVNRAVDEASNDLVLFCTASQIPPPKALAQHEHYRDTRDCHGADLTIVVTQLFGKVTPAFTSASRAHSYISGQNKFPFCISDRPFPGMGVESEWDRADRLGTYGLRRDDDQSLIRACSAVWEYGASYYQRNGLEGVSISRRAYLAVGGMRAYQDLAAAGRDLLARVRRMGGTIYSCPEAEFYAVNAG